MTKSEVTILANVRPRLGESPTWDAENEFIYWVDTLGQRIFRIRPDGREIRAWDVPSTVGSMALCTDTRAILAMRTGIHLFDFATGDLEFVCHPEKHLPGHTLNDGKVDREGRFVFGSMNVDGAEPDASLYRLGCNRQLERLFSGLHISNGPCFSPDGRVVYFSDSSSSQVYSASYPTEPGVLSTVMSFAAPVDGEGKRDGATVDAEGCVWSVLSGSGKIMRYDPFGNLIGEFTMPVRHVTSITFGGEDMQTIFVTSMSHPLNPKFEPDGINGGAVFAITGIGAKGLVEPRYVG